MKKKKLILIDANSIIHRAFHALPPLKTKKGEPAGAIYGSLLAFFKILSDFTPDYVGASFDSPGKTFRHEEYEDYKAHRPEAPKELISQIIKTQEVFSEMGVKVLAHEGLEADDIVGNISSLKPDGVEAVIATGDLDLLQLAAKEVKIYTFKRGVKEGVLYDKEKVKEKHEGVPPERIPDIKGLQGDPSDNIPGVEGIGKKTAIKLIKKLGSIEEVYSKIESDKALEGFNDNIVKKLKKDKEKAFLSKELATIRRTGFPEMEFSELFFKMNNDKIRGVLEELGFKSLAKRFSEDKEDSSRGNATSNNESENNLSFDF